MFSPRSTVVDMFGSSVPIWIFASLGGICIALILREVMIHVGWHRDLPMPEIFYSALGLIGGILINLIWIGGYR